MVWCGFNANFIVLPYFFDKNVTGNRYLEMSENHVVPFLRNNRALRKTLFQQDGSWPHIKKNVSDFLAANFDGGVIGQYFDFNWPPRSPDNIPMDFGSRDI
jgi:hypothetical protein